MHFQNPNLLWGLLALLAPLIIHFFNFRRLKKVNFSDISLLKEVNTAAKNFSELKNKWVLLLRMLAFACLVLAFANPYFGNKPNQNNTIAYVYLDNSASMQQAQGNLPNLGMAINKATQMLDLLPKSLKYYVLNNDFGSNDFEKRNVSNAKNYISKVDFSTQSRVLTDVLNRMNSLAQKEIGVNNNPQMYILSDFQKSTFGQKNNFKINPKANINLVQTATTNLANVVVDSVWLDNPFINTQNANKINVSIKNWGEKAVSNLVVRLEINGIVQNSVPTIIEAQKSNTLKFEFAGNSKATLQGKVYFDDQPVVFDNNFYFVINPSPKIKIVQIAGNEINGSIAVKNVFNNDSLFQMASMPAANVNFEILNTGDLIVLEGINSFEANLSKSVDQFVNRGGTIWYIPAEKIDENTLPFCLKSNLKPNYDLANTTLKWQGKNNEFFSDVFENEAENDKVKTADIKIAYTITGQKILETKGGQAYLTFNKTKGKVFILASPLSAAYGDMAKNALMVPIAYKIAQNSLKTGALSYRFGGKSLVFENKNYSEKTVLKIKKGEESFIPVQSFINNQIIMELPKATEWELKGGLNPGIFEVWNGNSLDQKLAINYDKTESDLAIYSNQELKSIFKDHKNVKIWEAGNMASITEEIKNQGQNKPWWKILVVLALVFIAAEVLMLRFWKAKV